MSRRVVVVLSAVLLAAGCSGASPSTPAGGGDAGTSTSGDARQVTGGDPSVASGPAGASGSGDVGSGDVTEPPEASGPVTSVAVASRTPSGLTVPRGAVTRAPVVQGRFYSVTVTVPDPVGTYRQLVAQMKADGFRMDFEEKGPLEPTGSFMARGSKDGRLVEVNTRGSLFYIVDAPAP